MGEGLGGPARDTNFDHVRAGVDVLVDSAAKFVRSAFDADAVELTDATVDPDPLSGAEYARPHGRPGVHRVAKAKHAVAAGPEVDDSREAGAKRRRSILRDRPAKYEVHVGVDKAGEEI